MDQAPLILRRKQEDESPCKDSIESSIEEPRILDGFASHGDVGEIAPECRDERCRRINAEDVKSFARQHLSDGKARPAPQVNDRSSARQRSGPLPYLIHADAGKTAAAATGQELLGDTFVSARSIHHGFIISRRARSLRARLAIAIRRR